jgi:hypothetical protein
MNKLIAVAFLIVAILIEPALGHAGTNTRLRGTKAQKQKPTPSSGCKKYFPLIGAVVSVPCS